MTAFLFLQSGRLNFNTGNVALRYARVLLEKYNSQPGGNKLPYRFKT